MARGVGTVESRKELYRFIDGCIPDKYIDAGEEREIFELAASLDISDAQTEGMVNGRCKKAGCTRESQVSWLLKVMLEEMTKDDGVIDKGEFDHVIGFAIALRMPRKDAIRTCVQIVKDNGWETQDEGRLRKRDWFAELADD